MDNKVIPKKLKKSNCTEDVNVVLRNAQAHISKKIHPSNNVYAQTDDVGSDGYNQCKEILLSGVS